MSISGLGLNLKKKIKQKRLRDLRNIQDKNAKTAGVSSQIRLALVIKVKLGIVRKAVITLLRAVASQSFR